MPADFRHITLPLLRALLAGKLDARAADQLVRATINRTKQAISWLGARKKFRFHTLGMTLRDLSYDISADLLAEGDEGGFGALRNALLGSVDATDEELLSAFDAVIFGNVQRRLSHIFAEVSPIQHTLLRALRQHTSGRDDLEVRDMFDGRWYFIDGEEQAELHKAAMPPELLRGNLPEFSAHNRSDVIEVFRNIIALLRSQDRYRKAVLEMDVVSITVEILGRDLDAAMLLEEEEVSVAFDVAVLSQVIQQSIETVRNAVEDLYIARNRLTAWEFDILMYAIKSSFLDLRWGEEQRSGYWFLRKYMPGLTPERYRESYRRKYSYLYDLVVQESQRLMAAESEHLK